MNARQINGTDRQQTTNKQTDINLFSFTDVSLSVRMQSFYKHILTHCNQYETLDLVQSSKDRSDLSPTLWDINLMIDLAQSVFEPMTIPKLSRIICMIQENYHVVILAIPIVPGEDDYTHKSISFTLYILLVNKNELFPCLTIDVPTSLYVHVKVRQGQTRQ